MRFSTSTFLLPLLPFIQAHTIFQRVSVNGADQGQLVGVRAPSTNNPVQDVTSSAITCNTGLLSPVSTKVISIPAGAKVGTWWQHVIGGPQGASDPDNPIASSHKGPLIVYLAKVSNSGTTGTTGLSWFKVAQEGLNSGKWGVDTMIAGNGWWYFTLPSCIAPGQYLMRVELIALHSAYSAGGAQFYISCANIEITGSGTTSPSSTVSFPGAYTANDPGITLNIYGTGGVPDNGGKPYPIPGPAVMTCGAGSGGGTTAAPTTLKASTTSTNPPATTTTASGAPLYGQCGGSGWTGATTCAQGTCTKSNDYYSQCLP